MGVPADSPLQSFVIIPARLASTRLPRKLLLSETGKSLIQHTYEAARRARKPAGVVVAADHEEIAEEVRRFGGNVELTDPAAASGTDRVAELAAKFSAAGLLVNVQGDEPEISGDSIDLAIQLLEDDSQAVMSTLATPIRDRKLLDDPACVKVVFDALGHALYFSRSPIPHARDWHDSLLTETSAHFYQHIGLYAYRREFLQEFTQLQRSDLERLESLEQLRVLSAGFQIRVGVVDHATPGIDTPQDYRDFVKRMKTRP